MHKTKASRTDSRAAALCKHGNAYRMGAVDITHIRSKRFSGVPVAPVMMRPAAAGSCGASQLMRRPGRIWLQKGPLGKGPWADFAHVGDHDERSVCK